MDKTHKLLLFSALGTPQPRLNEIEAIPKAQWSLVRMPEKSLRSNTPQLARNVSITVPCQHGLLRFKLAGRSGVPCFALGCITTLLLY